MTGSLEELIARLEKLPFGTREDDKALWTAMGHKIVPITETGGHQHERWIESDGTRRTVESTYFTTNLQCAVSIVPRDKNGGWYWRVGHGSLNAGWAHLNRLHPDHCEARDEVTAYASTPALALCSASLRARLSQQGGE